MIAQVEASQSWLETVTYRKCAPRLARFKSRSYSETSRRDDKDGARDSLSRGTLLCIANPYFLDQTYAQQSAFLAGPIGSLKSYLTKVENDGELGSAAGA
jgi:hypothetical protein